MLGKIKNIEEVHDIKPSTNSVLDYDGYKIETETDKILVLIDNQQVCCEDWGYMASDDDLSYFIGADLLEVNLTDTGLNKKMIEEEKYYSNRWFGGIQFVTFVTDKGNFQLAVYNAQNGNYGHSIQVIKNGEVIADSYF